MMSPGTLPVAWEMRRILCCKIRGGKRAGGPTGLVVAFATEVNLARGVGVGGLVHLVAVTHALVSYNGQNLRNVSNALQVAGK